MIKINQLKQEIMIKINKLKQEIMIKRNLVSDVAMVIMCGTCCSHLLSDVKNEIINLF